MTEHILYHILGHSTLELIKCACPFKDCVLFLLKEGLEALLHKGQFEIPLHQNKVEYVSWTLIVITFIQ